jgi:hypothetical protein
MESEGTPPQSDLLRLISMLPATTRSRLIALLYAMDDAKHVNSKLSADTSKYTLIIEMIID